MGENLGEAVLTLKTDDAQFNRGMGNAEQRMGKLGRKARGAGAALTAGLTAPIVGIGAAAVSSFMNFDAAMTQSTAIMTGVTSQMRGDMVSAAREMGRETTFSATDAAESFFFLASAGLDAESSILSLPRVAAFAQAGMFDMATATDLLTDAQSALGLTIRDDAVANMENMVRVSDVLVKANTLANATVQQFSESLTSEAGAALKTFGKDVEEGVAVLAAFADQGVKGQVAGTGLSRILRLMSTAALKNADAYDELNVSVFDAEGNMNNIADIIGDLEVALGDMSDAQRSAALESLGFKARIQGVILPLLGSSDAIRDYEAALREAGGTTEEVAGRQLESAQAQWQLFKGRLEDTAIVIGATLVPALLGLLDAVGPLLTVIETVVGIFGAMPGPVQAVAFVIVGLVAAAGPLLFMFGILASSFTSIIGIMPLLNAGFIALRSAMMTVAASSFTLQIALSGGILAVVTALAIGLSILIPKFFSFGSAQDSAGNAASALQDRLSSLRRELELSNPEWSRAKTDVGAAVEAYNEISGSIRAANDHLREAKDRLENVRDEQGNFTRNLFEARQGVKEWEKALEELEPAEQAILDQLRQMPQPMEELIPLMLSLGLTTDDIAAIFPEASESIEDTAEELGDLSEVAEDSEDPLGGVITLGKEIAGEFDHVRESLDALLGTMTKEEAALNSQINLLELAKVQIENNALVLNRDLTPAEEDQIAAIDREISLRQAQQRETDLTMQVQQDQATAMANEFLPTQEEVNELIGETNEALLEGLDPIDQWRQHAILAREDGNLPLANSFDDIADRIAGVDTGHAQREFSTLVEGIQDHVVDVPIFGEAIGSGFLQGVLNAFAIKEPEVEQELLDFSGLFSWGGRRATDAESDGSGIGWSFMGGVMSGISSRQSATEATVSRVFSSLPAIVRRLLGISSPSRVMRVIGEEVGEGLVVGLERAERSVSNAAGDIAAAIIEPLGNLGPEIETALRRAVSGLGSELARLIGLETVEGAQLSLEMAQLELERFNLEGPAGEARERRLALIEGVRGGFEAFEESRREAMDDLRDSFDAFRDNGLDAIDRITDAQDARSALVDDEIRDLRARKDAIEPANLSFFDSEIARLQRAKRDVQAEGVIEIDNQIALARMALLNAASDAHRDELRVRIAELQEQKRQAGVVADAEKDAIQLQIDSLQDQREAAIEAARAERDLIDARIDALQEQQRVEEIAAQEEIDRIRDSIDARQEATEQRLEEIQAEIDAEEERSLARIEALEAELSQEELALQAIEDEIDALEREEEARRLELAVMEAKARLVDQSLPTQEEQNKAIFEWMKLMSEATGWIDAISDTLQVGLQPAFSSFRQAIFDAFAPMIAAAIAVGTLPPSAMIDFLASLPALQAGAFNVPEQLVARLHQGEMVIPEAFADGLRGAIAATPDTASAIPPVEVTVHAQGNMSDDDLAALRDAASDGVTDGLTRALRQKGAIL